MEEEATIIGITNFNEIGEIKLYTNEEKITFLLYGRFINGIELDGMHILIAIGADQTIRSVNATLVPVGPEVYEATAKETLSKEQARRIAGQDIKSFPRKGSKPDLSKIEFKKYAIADAPYVIWDARAAGRHYRIDAFSGEILRKTEMRTSDP